MLNWDEYIEIVGVLHRKRFAQFFTPPLIAEFMVSWVLGGVNNSEVYDPAFGLGAFFDATPKDVSFIATDVDSQIVSYFKKYNGRQPTELRVDDYLCHFGRHYANIVCNPPYLRFQKFANRSQVFSLFKEKLGIQLSGYTNTASAFLLKSLSELDEKGRLAYILPSEFLNTGYGRVVKQALLDGCHLHSIVQIECEREAFSDATTSVCIVLIDNAKTFESVSFRTVKSLEDLKDVLGIKPVRSVPVSKLEPKSKWGCYFFSKDDVVSINDEAFVRLSSYGRFSRGIATGANEFFVLSNSDKARLCLPEKVCIPCITKSKQLTGATFTDGDFSKLSSNDESVFLFSPGEYSYLPEVQAYIKYGESMGYNARFITRNRTPWYKTEMRAPSPVLLNVFSRNGYKVVRNDTSVVTLTNFHVFYPGVSCGKYVDWIYLYLLSDVGHSILSLSKRKYGNSLEKFEPNDLNDAYVPCQAYFDGKGQAVCVRMMESIRNGADVRDSLNELFSDLTRD